MYPLRPVLLTILVLLALVGSRPALADPGFLVITPDRGFLGNDETTEALAAFQEQFPNTVLSFVTRDQTEENLRRAIDELRERSAALDEVVVLPLFLSDGHALYRKAEAALRQLEGVSIRFVAPMGTSYLAEELLFDRVRALLPDGFQAASGGNHGHGGPGSHAEDDVDGGMQRGVPRLVVVGSGAASAEEEAAIRADLEPAARRAAEKFGLAASRVAVLYEWSAPDDVRAEAFDRTIASVESASEHGPVIVIPFNLAPRLTTMMADWTRLRGRLSGINALHDGEGVVPHPNVERWLMREVNAWTPIAREDVGLILVPHGADHNWNEAMRAAMAPIAEKYVTEEAFSMVDPYVVERAVRRLEAKGMKAAILLRIFSLESSFKEQAEYMLGLRPEYHGPHAERIASHLRFATTGGMEAHPLLAAAMLDRAREVSDDPSKETVVLVAHGTGGDAQNAHWEANLTSIAEYVRKHGPEFRDVKSGTWREDWPDKRDASIKAIRAMVEAASTDGGTALVIPVRTIAQGPEADFLEGLTYRHGRGFAPHANFVAWLEEMIEDGMAQLQHDASSIARRVN